MKVRTPRIETGRLLLRLPERADFEGYAAFFADEEAARGVGGALPRGLAWRRFLQMPGAWAIQGFGMFSIIEKSTGTWLGQAGPWQPDGHNGTEVGWMLLRAHWGRGFATEAVTAAIDFSFATLGWSEVIHNILPDNAASIALAERVGSTFRGSARRSPNDGAELGVWGQTSGQWRTFAAQRSAARGTTRAER